MDRRILFHITERITQALSCHYDRAKINYRSNRPKEWIGSNYGNHEHGKGTY